MKWWFSVLDVLGVLNEEPDYTKVRNYWKYLKAKFKKENNQLVSATTQLKITAADGKKYKSDMLDSEGIIEFPFPDLWSVSDKTKIAASFFGAAVFLCFMLMRLVR